MKERINLVANDLVDKHGEKMPLSTLEYLRDDTNSSVKSSYKEHDYRFPPIGRVSNAFIKNESGINNLYIKFELFEINDVNRENKIIGKKLSINRMDKATITCDRSYELSGLEKDAKELQKLISDDEILKELKKSVEPISALIIGFGIFIGKSFFEGFFNKMGEEFWDKLKKLITKNSKINNNAQYIFSTIIENDKFSTEVMINFTNPIDSDLKKILESNKNTIDDIIRNYYKNSTKVSKIVFNSIDNKKIHHEYSLYEDGTPFDIYNLDKFEELLNDMRDKI